jgi:hypothetical protein
MKCKRLWPFQVPRERGIINGSQITITVYKW